MTGLAIRKLWACCRISVLDRHPPKCLVCGQRMKLAKEL